MDLTGIMGGVWAVKFRELEYIARGLRLVAREDPEEELRDAELPDGEQRAAVSREAARRVAAERA